jgi:hypothetical protein
MYNSSYLILQKKKNKGNLEYTGYPSLTEELSLKRSPYGMFGLRPTLVKCSLLVMVGGGFKSSTNHWHKLDCLGSQQR